MGHAENPLFVRGVFAEVGWFFRGNRKGGKRGTPQGVRRPTARLPSAQPFSYPGETENRKRRGEDPKKSLLRRICGPLKGQKGGEFPENPAKRQVSGLPAFPLYLTPKNGGGCAALSGKSWNLSLDFRSCLPGCFLPKESVTVTTKVPDSRKSQENRDLPPATDFVKPPPERGRIEDPDS